MFGRAVAAVGLKKRPGVPATEQGPRSERGWDPLLGGVLGGRGWQGGRQLVQGGGDRGGLESRSHKALSTARLGFGPRETQILTSLPHSRLQFTDEASEARGASSRWSAQTRMARPQTQGWTTAPAEETGYFPCSEVRSWTERLG